MTQEEKDLLLKDLCARLPYGVKIDNMGEPSILASINNIYRIIVKTTEADEEPNFNNSELDVLEIEDAKPYLFPISSMSEEQKEDMIKSSCGIGSDKNVFDWYNKNHFDYRGLIPIGLALDATGLNIY